MLKKWISGLLFAWIVFSPIQAFCQNVPLTDVNRIIVVDPNQPQFTIRLKSNPTTGFMWAVTAYDSRWLVWQWHDFEAPTHHMMGAPGVELFHFRLSKAALLASVARHGEIHFKYRRSWEKTNEGPQVTVRWSYTPKAKASKETG